MCGIFEQHICNLTDYMILSMEKMLDFIPVNKLTKTAVQLKVHRKNVFHMFPFRYQLHMHRIHNFRHTYVGNFVPNDV
jgi:hypothetical protein